MTATGPEPGWCFDPDDDTCERFWNGSEWTEHRRYRQPPQHQSRSSASGPAASVGAAGAMTPAGSRRVVGAERRRHDDHHLAERPPAHRRDDVAGVPTMFDESAPDRFGPVPLTAEGAWTSAEVTSAGPGVRRAVGVDVPAASPAPTDESRHEPSAPRSGSPPRADPPHSQSDPVELRVGGRAKVVAGDERFIGWVGQVVTLNSDNVELKINDAFGMFFRRDHVVALSTA